MGLGDRRDFRSIPTISADAILCLISEGDLEVLRTVAAHDNYAAAAAHLGTGPADLRKRVWRSMNRLGCATTPQLIALLRARWLIEVSPEEVTE